MLSAPREVHTDLQPVRYLQANLGPARFFELGPLQPNYGAYWGIASLNSNDIPTQPFFDFVRRRLDPYVDPTVFVGTTAGGRNVFSPSPQTVLERRLENYRASGVRFVLVPAGLRMPRPRGAFVLVHRTPTTWIYRLRGAAPYLGAARCAVRADGRERARVTCARPSTLVRRETALRGWRAEVDGREVPISRTAGIFQRVPLPAGTHEVRFAYRPPYVLWAIPLMALGVLSLVGAALLRRRRRDPAG
jgi:hypothetical protein